MQFYRPVVETSIVCKTGWAYKILCLVLFIGPKQKREGGRPTKPLISAFL